MIQVRVFLFSLPLPPSKKRGKLTVVLALSPPLGRDALFEEAAAAFLNPVETIFDITSDPRCIAAETAAVAGAPCDPSDRFAKISGRDWKYLFKKKINKES